MFLITLQSIPNVKILIMKLDSEKGKKKKIFEANDIFYLYVGYTKIKTLSL